MELRPILSVLCRNKAGAVLIALQMAVTLAILCNAIFIVRQRVARTERPSGVDETDDFAIQNEWIGTPPNLGSIIQADVEALRAIPTVTDAFASNTYPFISGEATIGITLHPDRPRSRRTAAVYMGDQHAMDTLGFKLSAGRNFDASDINDIGGAPPPTNGILVTRALADQLAPGGKVLGRIATLAPPLSISAPIVGIIDTLQAPDVNAPGGNAIAGNSIVLPYRPIGNAAYVIRAEPGHLAQAMKAAPAALAHVSRQRIIRAVFSLAEERQASYSGDSTLALLLTLVCLILLAVTAFGMIGLTNYWVSQRRRQIGIRRALGATRLAIMQYFQTENLLISSCGIAAGVVLAIAGNLWVVKHFAVDRLPDEYLLVGAVALITLGQLAVLWPALRAASVPPAVATRDI